MKKIRFGAFGVSFVTSIALSAALSSGVAFAGPRDFVVEHAGIAGAAENSQAAIASFLRLIEEALGWPANSAVGQMFEDSASANKYVAEKKPGFGMVDPDYLAELKKKGGVTVLASADT